MCFGSLASRFNQVILEDDKDQQKEWAEWEDRSVKTRSSLGMPSGIAPWTSCHRLVGVPPLPRHLDAIDVAYWAWKKSRPAGDLPNPTVEPTWFVDYSQNVDRKAWGPYPDTITKRSRVYAFHLDRRLDGEDCFASASSGLNNVGRLRFEFELYPTWPIFLVGSHQGSPQVLKLTPVLKV